MPTSGDYDPVPRATPMVPYVCMQCGSSRSLLRPGTPYCLNHGSLPGIAMVAFPLTRLRTLLDG
jgi:hypothetical protein